MCKVKTQEHPRRKKNKNGEVRQIDVRGLRRCNNEECRVFMNRDYNASINIRLNLLHKIETGNWDPVFSQSYDSGLPCQGDISASMQEI